MPNPAFEASCAKSRAGASTLRVCRAWHVTMSVGVRQPQSRTDLPGRFAGCRRAQDASLVTRRETPPLRQRNDLRIGQPARRLGGHLFSRPTGSLRGAHRAIHSIHCKQSLLLLVHDLYLPFYNKLTKEGVSHHSDTGGRLSGLVQREPASCESGTAHTGYRVLCQIAKTETGRVTCKSRCAPSCPPRRSVRCKRITASPSAGFCGVSGSPTLPIARY